MAKEVWGRKTYTVMSDAEVKGKVLRKRIPYEICQRFNCKKKTQWVVWYNAAGKLWTYRCSYHLIKDFPRGVREFVNVETGERYRIEAVPNV